jgi:FkbM family methyltransferase
MYNDQDILLGKYIPDCQQLKDAYFIKNCIDRRRYKDAMGYESFTYKFIEAAKKARSFIDVGAAYGYYTYAAYKNMPKGSKIHSIEPDPERYNTLTKVFSDCDNIDFINNAVSAHEEIVTLYGKKGSRLSATMDANLSQRAYQAPELMELPLVEHQVKAITLDALCGDNYDIDIVKMDIEGGELYALEGMSRILERRKTRLFLEVHYYYIESLRKGGVEFIDELLHDAGYTVYECYEGFVKKLSSITKSGRYYIVPSGEEP